jgi:hypothetical protein
MRDIKSIKADINAKASELSKFYKEMMIAQGVPIESTDHIPYGGAVIFTPKCDMTYIDTVQLSDMLDRLKAYGIFGIVRTQELGYIPFDDMIEFGKALDEDIANRKNSKEC